MRLRATAAHASAQRLWTPALLSTALWLDAADASTITLNGSTVSAWKDKTGNGVSVAQTNAAKQPAVSANQQNGLQGMYFDGSRSLFASTSAINLSQPYSRFFVARFQSKTTKSVLCDSESVNFQAVFYNGEASPAWTVAAGNNPNFSAATYGTPDFTTHLHSNVLNGASSAQSLDGSVVNTANPGATGLPGLRIGNIRAEAVAGYNFNGYLFEFIVLASSPAADVRARIEGYLAHKWGLAANLPAAHPHKSTPPRV